MSTTKFKKEVRVAVVSNYYQDFLDSHYYSNAELEKQSYEVQVASLISSGFGDSDIYSSLFDKAGLKSIDLIPNCRPLQIAWQKENPKYSSVPWGSVWVYQALEFGVSILYLHDMNLARETHLSLLRSLGIAVICQIASPIPQHVDVRMIDGFVTSFPHFVDIFTSSGKPVLYSPLAFDGRKALMSVTPFEMRSHEILFVGGIGKHHSNFLPILDRLCERFPVTVYGYTDGSINEYTNIRASYKGMVWGNQMYRALGDTKISLNRHSLASSHYANNLRLFESMGMGALLLTDKKVNNSYFFSAGNEALEYVGDNIFDIVEWSMNNQSAAASIAERGRIRCLTEHQFVHRSSSLVDFLLALLRS